jgi:hypothetical protein
MKVKVQRQTLTDGSEVFNVVLLGILQTFQFGAVSERDAELLADALIENINKHTVQEAEYAF